MSWHGISDFRARRIWKAAGRNGRGLDMNVELLYRYLFESSWVFLGGWTVLLLAASVIAFRHDFS